jgi:hypothetical protein
MMLYELSLSVIANFISGSLPLLREYTLSECISYVSWWNVKAILGRSFGKPRRGCVTTTHVVFSNDLRALTFHYSL